MDKLMKIMLFAASFLACIGSYAQESIEGNWAGKLEAAPGTVISVHFAITKDAAGGWAAVLNSPDTGAIKDVKASAVSFDGTKLDIKVDALSGSYSGMLANGTFTGEWTQPGSTLAMNLAPYEASVLSDEAVASLLGQWHGKLQGPGIVLNMVFYFERNEAGEFVGSLQQIDTSPNKTPMTDISFENNELFFRVPAARAEYSATFADGGFNGHLKQGAQNMELNVVKGEYVAEAIALALSPADFAKLAGEWSGTLTPPGGAGELTLIMTFKRDETGAIAGTFQSPQQGNALLKITTASLTGNTLAVALTVPPASFTGELDGTDITGTWSQGPASIPLVLTKK
jgi:hypothetical protein